MELLRFTTAGSVDDGKSTLIGRLLYDSKSIFEDQLEAVEAASRSRGNEEVNLALLTDGLRSEREQGITIDVAYRYFATPRRKFIIADTPGHIQYTRNMVTGASTAHLAVILIDARNGIREQTIRHSFIASLLGIRHVAVCVNKMDLVEWSREVFEAIRAEYMSLSAGLGLSGVHFIPISAKLGDNVVERSAAMPWYDGPPLMELLETVQIEPLVSASRLPVQMVIRPISDRFHDFRGYAGRVAGGSFGVGDRVVVWPRGERSTVSAITLGESELQTAQAGESVALQLADDIDVGRGDLICGADDPRPTVSQDLHMRVCWFNARPLRVGEKYVVRHTTRQVQAVIKSIDGRTDISTLRELTGVESVAMNDIATIALRTSAPIAFDPYAANRTTGSVIFVDPNTFETAGCGMLV
jgi:sulfate adenylyltransferase subunit 1